MPVVRRTFESMILFFQKLFRWVLYFDGNTHIKFKPITLSGANGYFIEFKYKGTSIDYRSVLINSATGKRICRFNLGGTFRFYSPDEASTVTGSISVTDDKEHVIRLEVYNGSATLLIDGQLDQQTANASWSEDHVIDSSAPAGLAGYLYDINLNDEYEYIIDEGEGVIAYNSLEPELPELIDLNNLNAQVPAGMQVVHIENGIAVEVVDESVCQAYPSVKVPGLTLAETHLGKVTITSKTDGIKGFYSVGQVTDTSQRLIGETVVDKPVYLEKVVFDAESTDINFYIDTPTPTNGDRIEFTHISAKRSTAGNIENSQSGSWQEVQL
ncbi:hypothetical protein P7F88_19305 [Vibrio hannami]|uniref:hypothetical protein n=1 Tax=Vibrio hannami TaxID=2717094 RepID=UPI00240F26E1|nr:hypothetical protein [Vibrio hannami]MDG3088104.1 hypothetical protein [Vibrio hannami]